MTAIAIVMWTGDTRRPSSATDGEEKMAFFKNGQDGERFWRLSSHSRHPRRLTSRNKLRFEPLEARVLLASDLTASWSAELSVFGDYSQDGTVNAADYTVWRDSLGDNVTPGIGADGSGNGAIDQQDYDMWSSQYGSESPAYRVELSWAATPDATSYNIKRSSVSGGPYTTIATGITGTQFSDPAPAGVEHYYVVSPIVGGVEGADSAEASAIKTPRVSVVNTEGVYEPDGFGASFAYDYTVQRDDSVLVVATYIDATGGAYTDLTFDGNAADGSLVGNRTSLFYYLNPGAGSITLSASSSVNNSGMYIWELTGVDKSVGVVGVLGAEGDANGTQITTIADDSFIVDAIGWNATSVFSTTTAGLTPDGDNTTIAIEDFSREINLPYGGILGGGTGTAGVAGTYDLGWNITQSEGGQGNLNEMAFAFAPTLVPYRPVESPYRSTSVWDAYDGGIAPSTSGYFDVPFMPVTDTASSGSLRIAGSGQTASIYYSEEDAAVVGIAANALREDVQTITGLFPTVSTDTPAASEAILIGTIGSSPLIDGLIAAGKIDVSAIEGKWEAYTAAVVDNPMAGVAKALVIAGSDRRGTAFGVFGLSESMGVSPWHWFADVPTAQRPELHVSGAHTQGSPGVKYRGIFINDEDEGLAPWASQIDPSGNVGPTTYAKIYELLLRLHANYMWPAMHWATWPFYTIPGNAEMADQYAIVIGTSHHEPMLINTLEYDVEVNGEYNYWTNREGVYDFWEQRVVETKQYESVYTVGMRGLWDDGMDAPPGTTIEQKKDMIQDYVIPDQRQMITDHVNSDPSEMPQVFVPYKEALLQYQAGLQLPDDIMLAWVDDNHGYIRQLSDSAEQTRSGGSGVYYHLSYWGASVRENYLWLQTTPPAFTNTEMLKAWDYQAESMWIVNVGDIKPHEIGMEHFLRMARDPEAYRDFDQHEYFVQWADHHFGSTHAEAIAAVLDEYYRLNIVTRPEQFHLTTSGFSFVDNGDEAQQRLDDFSAVAAAADAIYAQLPADQKAAFYEMILYPVRGSNLVNQKVLNAERSRLWESQGRAATNALAATVQAAQDSLVAETTFYNEVNAGGKWDEMMTEATSGAYSSPNLMPTVGSYSASFNAGLGVAIEGVATPIAEDDPGELPVFQRPADPEYFVDVFNTGLSPMSWTAQSDVPWVTLSQTSGSADTRIMVGIDWDAAPREELAIGVITIQGAGSSCTVYVGASYPLSLDLSQLPAAVESNHQVVIEAEDFASVQDATSGTGWRTVDSAAASNDGVTVNDVTTPSIAPAVLPGNSPMLSYEFYAFSAGETTIEVRARPTHQINAEHPGARIAISLNDDTPQVLDFHADVSVTGDFYGNIYRAYATKTSYHTVSSPGLQAVKIWMVDPGVVLDNLIVSINSGLFEAERLSFDTAGAAYHAFFEGDASGGGAMSLDSTAVGQSITFTLPDVEPGDYDLIVRVKKGDSRGVAQVSIGDAVGGPFTDAGSPIDLYAPSFTYVDLPSVPVSFSSASSTLKAIKFTVTGKNASSTGYRVVVDSMTLAPSIIPGASTANAVDDHDLSLDALPTAQLTTITELSAPSLVVYDSAGFAAATMAPQPLPINEAFAESESILQPVRLQGKDDLFAAAIQAAAAKLRVDADADAGLSNSPFWGKGLVEGTEQWIDDLAVGLVKRTRDLEVMRNGTQNEKWGSWYRNDVGVLGEVVHEADREDRIHAAREVELDRVGGTEDGDLGTMARSLSRSQTSLAGQGSLP